MSGHTPGPWTVGISPVRGTLYVGSPDAWICGELDNPNTPLETGEAEANARLIAAAPDYDYAAGLAINALAFAAEGYQRSGDQLALAQTLHAKNALITAQDKARGRDIRKMRDVSPRVAVEHRSKSA